MRMKTGFIGAGKVGFSFGKYLTERGIGVSGYLSQNLSSSAEAAKFTGTRAYDTLEELVRDSDILLLSVPDGAIASVWEELKLLPIQNKLIGHFSGSLSSAVFSEIGHARAYGYSIHPLIAVSDKYQSFRDLAAAPITLEGDSRYLDFLASRFRSFGNPVQTIAAEDKVRYHAACAMASNLYVGLVDLCERMLTDCGFSPESAHTALTPLIEGNVRHILEHGAAEALTGPCERGDLITVRRHLDCLSPEEQAVYRALSRQTLRVAKQKHPERDYQEMEGVLQG